MICVSPCILGTFFLEHNPPIAIRLEAIAAICFNMIQWESETERWQFLAQMPGGPVIDEEGLAVQSTGEPLPLVQHVPPSHFQFGQNEDTGRYLT